MLKIFLAAVVFLAFSLQAEETLTLGEFLPEIKEYYRTPVSKARWLWLRKAGDPYAACTDITQVFNEGPRKVCFRTVINISGKIKKAWIRYIVDKRGRAFLDGVPLARIPDKKASVIRSEVPVWYLDMSRKFHPGKNVLAFEVDADMCGWRGLLMIGEIELVSGEKIPLFTSKHFKASDRVEKNWNTRDFDDSAWRNAWEQGDVRMGPYQVRFPVARFFCTQEEYARYQKMVQRECNAVKHIAEEPEPRGKIVYGGNLPGFDINGRILPPVMYLTFSGASENRDNIVAKMYQAGVRIFMFGVPDETLYNNKESEWVIDIGISRLLKLAPEAYFILQTAVMQEKEWLKKNPDERVGYSNPVKPRAGGRPDDDGYYGGQLAPSFASEAYRKKVAQRFIDFMKYASAKPWGRRIIGCSIGYGPSGDGLPFGVVNGMPDCGKRMTEAFRRYLAEKYKNNAALQKAWQDKSVTLETAQVPDRKQRWNRGHFLHDPAAPAACRLLDYYRCYHQEFAGFIISVGKEIKTALPGRMFGAYFGYLAVHYPAPGVTADFERVINSPYVDWNMGTTYGYHRTDCLHLSAPGAYKRAGKLSSSEADIRTYIASLSRPDNPVTRMSKTPSDTRATVRKMLATTLLNGCGVHFNCFATTPDWFNTPAVLEPLKQHIQLWNGRFSNKWQAENDIAVVVDPIQRAIHGPPVMEEPRRLGNDNFFGLFYRGTLNALSYSGYSYDIITLDNFLSEKTPRKVVIFLNLYEINGKKRQALLEKVRQKGVTSFWFYAPGLISEKGFSDDSMSGLTGMKLKAFYKRSSLASRELSGKVHHCKLIESPRVYCADDRAEQIAVYTEGEKISMARKILPGGAVSVFCGLPLLRSDSWAALLSQSGCHAYVKPGTFARARGDLLMLGTRISGNHVIRLPFKARKVIDLYSGRTVFTDTDKFTVRTTGWTTFFWKIIK